MTHSLTLGVSTFNPQFIGFFGEQRREGGRVGLGNKIWMAAAELVQRVRERGRG